MTEEKIGELKCYGCLDNDGKVCKISSDEYKSWRNRYRNDLKLYTNSDVKTLDRRCYPYTDPDGSYHKGCDHSFFCDLVKFLIKQEKQFKEQGKEQGNFEYKFVEDKGIEVSGTDGEDNKITSFYLRSDQFGFSAPSNKKSHPYDMYIGNCNDEARADAVNHVTDWIAMTRTIGGSFLCTAVIHRRSCKNKKGCNYNELRGGSASLRGGSYIEDRVDLTLLEIKHLFEWICADKAEKESVWEKYGDIIFQDYLVENNNDEEMKSALAWLRHFCSFENYIKFFCFENFVVNVGQGEEKNHMPIDIVKSILTDVVNIDNSPQTMRKVEVLKYPTEYKKRRDNSIFKSNYQELEEMLENVSILTLARSHKMQKIIDETSPQEN